MKPADLPLPFDGVDWVIIDDLRVEAVIGVHDWEWHIRQPLLFSLRLLFDNTRAAASGDLGDTLDYAVISEAIVALAAEFDGELIEQLAERCAQMLADDFGVQALQLRIDKPLAAMNLGAARVGIRICRDWR